MGTKSMIAALALFGSQAFAAISTNVSVTSDYVFRGLTQTNHQAAVQGGLDWDSGFGLSVGTWLSNALTTKKGASQSDTESDFYLSYSHEITKDISVSVGAIYYNYLYNGAVSIPEYNVGATLWGAKVTANYTAKAGGIDKNKSWYFSATRNFTLCEKDKLDLVASLGYVTISKKELADVQKNYFDYKVALEKTVDTFVFDLNYTNTINHKNFAGVKAATDKSYFVSLTKKF